MVASPTPGFSAQRLAAQLHRLTEMTETLTFRLLELEETLQAQEERLRPLLEGLEDPEAISDDELDGRLSATETRLSLLEDLLNGGDAGPGGRHLHPVAPVAGAGEATDSPFPDEGEQPFMDELPA